ncbi:hypothetical protein LR48_Vigan02g055700 [Vigna angularis]|uniref:DUF7081 domain-containing protein n=2 Tax=Phaseolus angularis TaxID=3914 RepID=A0A0L9TVG3_PHAAN|nr:uncharacterized protein LOC108325080 isoform X1 [Vigna angularis]KAG2403245.1 uncharacterized protein HKW66_Vig0185310 [Vigna angularis]KOM34407.1 hypothetical protein LR48_Vigan02g055700 [Vigna angularis]BAT96190.1 hypothetical protein VIGAN_08308700 [Vigna angularis var. angularis]
MDLSDETVTPTSFKDEKESLKNDSAIGNNAYKDVTNYKTSDLQPVPSYSSGKGLPYAPEGWPNAGDVWGWRVAARTAKGGYFTDRYLIPPASLRKGSRRLEFSSKTAVSRYLHSNFPDMRTEAFFALFTWLIPSAEQTPTKETVQDDDTGTLRKSKRKIESSGGLTKNSGGPTKSSGRQSKKRFALVPVGSLVTPLQVANFDSYLDNLEDMLDIPLTETTASDHPTNADIESIESCKKKLSSLLALDFPSLASSNDVAEVAILASQIREDPNLTVDQLFKLKLVEQVPLAGEAFLEAKESIEEVDKVMAELMAKKLRIPSLKKKYNDLKEKLSEREAEMDISALSITEIDDQIRQLEAKRKRISGALETMQKDKDKISSELSNVTDSISTLVHEIQYGISQKSKWDLKKANNVRRVAEIQEKFLTLRGLTF